MSIAVYLHGYGFDTLRFQLKLLKFLARTLKLVKTKLKKVLVNLWIYTTIINWEQAFLTNLWDFVVAQALLDIQEFYELTLMDESKSVHIKTSEALQMASRWEDFET